MSKSLKIYSYFDNKEGRYINLYCKNKRQAITTLCTILKLNKDKIILEYLTSIEFKIKIKKELEKWV